MWLGAGKNPVETGISCTYLWSRVFKQSLPSRGSPVLSWMEGGVRWDGVGWGQVIPSSRKWCLYLQGWMNERGWGPHDYLTLLCSASLTISYDHSFHHTESGVCVCVCLTETHREKKR